MQLLAIGVPGPFELIIIALIVVLIFGVGRLPEVGGAVGKSIREFRKATKDDEAAVDASVNRTDTDVPAPAAAAAENTAFCSECGGRNARSAKFCSSCGHAMGAAVG
ncbi:MAG: twin-arginine translocase TatA/TatE family subunit [Chloroflexi bacterium]|nr:twin-arginine translocase TatA/TatE family subunit [Chloroflexota bacterium]